MARHLKAARSGPQREIFHSDALSFDLLRQPEIRIEQHVEVGLKPLRLFRPPVAADPIHVAGDRYQCEERSEGLNARARPVDPVSGYETGRPLA